MLTRRSRNALLTALGVGVVVLLVPALAHAAGGCADDAASFEKARQNGWLAAYLGSFGAGFATSLTPCVYPMIPITLAIFGARGKDVGRGKAIALASMYVLGLAVTFTTLGVGFAMLGRQTGTLLADPRFVIPLVILFAILAASMFGAFELNLPASWQTKLSQVGGTGYRGAFMMGLVGAFIAAPCTGPFLGGILSWVSTTGDIAFGGSVLLAYALGMGVLFFVLAATAASLPKSGRWMEWVKSTGGVALLGAGLYFLRPLVPFLREWGQHNLGFLAAAIAVTALGLGLGAIHLSFHDRAAIKARKAGAVAMTVAGAFSVASYFIAVPPAPPAQQLSWIHDDEPGAFAKARAEHKGVMVDFGATWCGACIELEHTFAADGVRDSIASSFVPLKLDVSEGTKAQTELQEKYKAETLPAVIFLDPDHHELGRVREYLPADGFRCVLDPAAAEIRRWAERAAAR